MALPPVFTVVGPAPLRGRLRVPGDKSVSHRALLFAALANGRSRLVGLADGEDVARTQRLLRDLGVSVEPAGDSIAVHGHGVESFEEAARVLDCGNSGTTIRTGAGLLAGRPFLSVLAGDASLARRPMARVVAPLREMGATVDGRAGGTLPPLVVRGGPLTGRALRLPVASAQVKTALVLAGLQASGVTEVTEPSPSRDHTERMLAAAGAPVSVSGRTVRVQAGAPAPFALEVPGDPSSAAFFVVAAVVTPGSEVIVEDVGCNPTRIAFVDVLRRMGARVDVEVTGERLGEPVGEIRAEASALRATRIAGEEIPLVQDELPALAVAAGFAEGVTEVADAAELRVKESDRVAGIAGLLGGLGVDVEVTDEGFAVHGGAPRAAAGLPSLGDHRLAMAAAIAANAVDGQSTVEGWESVAVSYPRFADDLAAMTGRTPAGRA